jgi:monomeric isocitrate dehydrogenase
VWEYQKLGGIVLTKKEYLLTLIMEECAEIQKNCSKIMRFGDTSKHPDGELTNLEELIYEVIDLAAVLEMLQDEGIIELPDDGERYKAINMKKRKVEKYMEISRKLGTLQ